jgi:arginyl-tRNA synthetase
MAHAHAVRRPPRRREVIVSSFESVLSATLGAAFTRLAGAPADPLVQRSTRTDFQANGVLALARRLGRPPREVAGAVLADTDLTGLAAAEISGPGFINLTVDGSALDAALTRLAADERLGVVPAAHPEVVVLDYAGPNVAKEMHVGHLRSAIIGDALVRVLRFAGHDVRIVSHIGDWGTPFGMLVERLVEVGEAAAAQNLSVGDLDGFYKAARARFDADPEFADRARKRVVALQAGDPETLRLWRLLVTESERYFMEVNGRLGLLLKADDFVGESAYNAELDGVVDELAAKGLLTSSQGAECAFPPGFTGRDGEPFPLIVRKSDGGYGYAATDLAALRHRAAMGDRLVYVVGSPQHQYLEMVFAVGRQAGWLAGGVDAEHVGFGSVLDVDGRMLRSRAGRSAKLIDLLNAAVARAAAVIAEKSPDLDEATRAEVAEIVGVGAVKYADLSADRIKDYVFDLDRMVSFTGDTGAYLQMAYARIRSIQRKAGDGPDAPRQGGRRGHGIAGPIRVAAPAERALALRLLAFADVVDDVARDLDVHKLAGYLRALACAFTDFFETCPVLRAPDAETRAARLALCDVTARVLGKGLDLMGLRVSERL